MAEQWLFSRGVDLGVFGGSAIFSLALSALAPVLGISADVPLWAWVLCVLCIDVAHVWSTLFRVYFDAEELKRRPLLYAGAPLLAYALGVFAWQWGGSATFWKLLAYVAVLHFVRQQVGWMTLYGRRAGSPAWAVRVDQLAIYGATLGPIVWWHAHLPRPFWWFVEGDFSSGVPEVAGTAALIISAVTALVWVVAQLRQRQFHVGKWTLLAATWAVWFGGIVLAQTDFAFTVSNVALHGVPYFALLYRYGKGRAQEPGYRVGKLLRFGVPAFLAVLVLFAFAEEFLWDRLVWHDRPELFGASPFELADSLLAVVVPLLILPQATHYLLDGFIWRSKENPFLSRRLGWIRSGL